MFRRRPIIVRRTPGLLGTVARTAAIAGTAAMTTHAISSRYQNQPASAAQAQAESQEIVALEQQVQQLQAGQAQAAAPASSGMAAAPGLADQLTQLATLRSQGILSDAEYEAAKAKLLA